MIFRSSAWPTWFRDLGHRGNGGGAAPQRGSCQDVRKHGDGPGPSGEPTVVTRILAGEVDLIVNTPFGSQGSPARASTATRSAPPRSAAHPLRHHAAGLAAAVHGIEAIIRGEVGVRSLQGSRVAQLRTWRALRTGGRSCPAGKAPMAPVQIRGTVLTLRRVDAYTR